MLWVKYSTASRWNGYWFIVNPLFGYVMSSKGHGGTVILLYDLFLNTFVSLCFVFLFKEICQGTAHRRPLIHYSVPVRDVWPGLDLRCCRQHRFGRGPQEDSAVWTRALQPVKVRPCADPTDCSPACTLCPVEYAKDDLHRSAEFIVSSTYKQD